jgi:diguanylate cyclase (GGDEF)-like protein/PAS domain S-box-containing protein
VTVQGRGSQELGPTAARPADDLLRAFVHASDTLLCIVDGDGRILLTNPALQRFTGRDEDELEGQPFWDVYVAPEHVLLAQDAVARAMATGVAHPQEGDWLTWDGERRRVSMRNTVLRDDDGQPYAIGCVGVDVTHDRQREAQLHLRARTDLLTGIANRGALFDALHGHLQDGPGCALLFCDLDRFKTVNDEHGHAVGDALLVEVAGRLTSMTGPNDLVSRFGGDEFVILCDDMDHDHDAAMIAERVHAAVHEPPLTVENTEVFAAVSIGIAFAQPNKDPETMIRDADAAMYLAKARGRARYEIYDERLRATLIERLDIETALRRALTRRELRVVYQPTIDLLSGKVVGVEALLRWEHPERGPLVPREFMDVAEETGLIVPIGTWVVEQACRQAQRWQAGPDGEELFVSVNLSSRQLESTVLIENIASVLTATAITPARLGLEITESVVMRDPEASTTALRALKDLGVRLAVDDFGTGYSSLAYLRRFPVDLLKVDQAFVDGLGRDPEDSAIVAAVVSLAHTLGMKAIAEGVETAEQLHELRVLGCDMAQGFYMSRPLIPADLDDLLATSPTW